MKDMGSDDRDLMVGRRWDLPTSLIELRVAIGDGGMATPKEMHAFLKTPAAGPMPKPLRAEVARWLKS